mgnify:CR=1 FL=1
MLAGVAIGTYVITDIALQVWHEHQDGKLLSPSDLAVFGIEVESVLDIHDVSDVEVVVVDDFCFSIAEDSALN